MSAYTATVTWRRDGQDFLENHYSPDTNGLSMGAWWYRRRPLPILFHYHSL